MFNTIYNIWDMEATYVPTDQWMVHIHNGILLSHKKEGIWVHSDEWMYLEPSI